MAALHIKKAFGVSMDMLLRMQAWLDSHPIRPAHRRNRRQALRAGVSPITILAALHGARRWARL
jgi:plasmid maintenance system antidote protein VapI